MRSKRAAVGIVTILFVFLSATFVMAAPAKGPIKIGFISSITGVFAEDGIELRNGFQLYLEENGYKVGDRKIEVIVEDDGGNPSVGLTKARKLVEKDKVHFLAGVFSSGIAYALRDYVHEAKIPLLICNAGADGLTKQKASPYIFRLSFSNSQQNKVFADYAYNKLGYRKAILVAQDYPAAWEWDGGFAYNFTKNGGEIVQEFYPKLGTTDYAPYILAMDLLVKISHG